MKTAIINIGNSKGIIIPSSMLRELNLSSKSSVQLQIADGSLVIKPAPREGWAEAAAELHAAGDDELLLDEPSNDFDKDEWTW